MANSGLNLKNYITEEVDFPDNALILDEGCKFNAVYLVLEGQVKVRKKTDNGAMTLETLKTGAIVGELCLLLQDARLSAASVVADGAVRLAALDTEKILDDYHSMGNKPRELLDGIMTSLLKANAFLSTVFAPAD